MDAARRAALACLSARFSFNDFPDFLVMVCRGDLSDITGPLHHGGLVGPDSPTLPHNVELIGSSGDEDVRGHLGAPTPLWVYRQTSWEPS
jgi:hypothetical protein